MSEAKFTPGPWELWTGCSWRRFGSGLTGKKICVPCILHDGQPDLIFPNGGQDGPDVNLILAAPEMYAVLKRIEPIIEAMEILFAHKVEGGTIAEDLHFAIDKAEGQS